MGDACGIEGGAWHEIIRHQEERSPAGMAYSLQKTFGIKMADLTPVADRKDCYTDASGVRYQFNHATATWVKQTPI
jgi:hypothetical protein